MKKILPLLLFIVFFVHTGMSQKVSWSEKFQTPTKNKSLLQYVGHSGDTYYFSYDYYNWHLFSTSQDDISLIAIRNGEVVAKSEKFDIKRGSLEKIYLEGNQIKVIYSYYNRGNGTYEVFCRNIDAKTLKLQNEKILLSFESEKKNEKEIFFRQSPDHSKVAISYMDVEKKSRKGYLNIYIFDSQYNIITNTRFFTEMEEEIGLVDFFLDNAGELKIVGINKLYNKKKLQRQNFFVATVSGESPIMEKVVKSPNTYELKFCKAAFTKEGQLVIAGIYDDDKVQVYTLDMETEKMLNEMSFPMERKFAWQLDTIKALDNNSVVIVCEDVLMVYTTSQTGTANSTEIAFCNRGIRLFCVDPHQKAPVYKKLITRSTAFTTSGSRYSTWLFEKPSYFVKGNTFYALYNTSKKVADFQEKPIKKIKTNLVYKNKRVVSNLTAFDPNGKASVSTILWEKKDKARFAPLISKQIDENKVIISKVAKGKYVTIGTLSLD